MVTTLQRIGAAALSTARQLAADQAGQPFSSIQERYELLSRYYHNEMYETKDGSYLVAQYLKSDSGRYRNIRPIRNPIRRAVDSYPGNVYPGAMTPDGLSLPDGTPSCVPFASDTDEAVRLAMIQTLVWANWGRELWQVIRNLAVLGDAFGEIEIDYERGVVYPKFHHPGRVTDMRWNGSGDVVMYRLEIPQVDGNNRSYTWGKIVDKETITTLKNGKPFGYDDQPAVTENPWGFVPAAWAQFRNVGGQHGASIVDGVRSKIDELNSSLSSIHDYIMKFSNQGIIFKTEKPVGDIVAFTPGVSTSDRTNPQGGRQEIRYLKGPSDLQIDRLIQNLGLAETVEHMHDLIAEIEEDLPESTIESKIHELSQPPSGRALRMMFRGVESRVSEAQGNADHLLVKLMQMGTSIGGELVNSGAFGMRRALTEQQQRFLPFGLDSFKAGDLSVTLLPRPLFPDSPLERTQTAIARESVQTIQGLRDSGFSDDEIFGDGNIPAVIPGLLEQRQNASNNLSDVLGRALAQPGQGEV